MLLGVTGGIAAYKAALVARSLVRSGADVQVVMTSSAERFVGAATFAALTGNAVPGSLWERPSEVTHVRLAHDADLIVIAPATANLLAKLAHGIADDLLTATVLESSAPLVLAPAMHTGMWEHQATRTNVAMLVERGAHLVGPDTGPLAAGDEGAGRMAEPEVIVAAVSALIGRPADLAGRRVVVTAGPTQEPVDPVRFIGNRSSGKMGLAVAQEAHQRGAVVELILGPGTVEPPAGIPVVRVSTAEEMRDAVSAAFGDADVVVMAAAVADFRPKSVAGEKLKKGVGVPELLLEPTPDILSELGERKGNRVLVGFAAETEDLEINARRKLSSKHLDLVVANRVGEEGTGFGSETNDALILSAAGVTHPMRRWAKAELAEAICDQVSSMLGRDGKEAGP